MVIKNYICAYKIYKPQCDFYKPQCGLHNSNCDLYKHNLYL